TFFERAPGVRHVERGAGGEGDEVDRVAREVAHRGGKEGEPVCVGEFVAVDHVEPGKVLPGDLGVGADVDNVDTVLDTLEVFDSAGDDPLGHHRLAQPHF